MKLGLDLQCTNTLKTHVSSTSVPFVALHVTFVIPGENTVALSTEQEMVTSSKG